MMSLLSIQEKLMKFESLEGMEVIINGLAQFHADIEKSSSENNDIVVERLRGDIQKMLLYRQSKHIKKENVSLADMLHETLLALANYRPINLVDPITQDEIDEDEKIFVSSGYQFNLTTLIEYHHVRIARGIDLHENNQSKWLINPITNIVFTSWDIAHIQAVCNEKGIKINDLRTMKSAFLEGKHNVKKNSDLFIRGETILKQLSEMGYAKADYLLANIYFDQFATQASLRLGGPEYLGKKQNYQLGLIHLLKAVDAGHKTSIFMYVEFLYNGNSELKIKKNVDKAMQFLDELISQDYLPSVLAKLYFYQDIRKRNVDELDTKFSLLIQQAHTVGISEKILDEIKQLSDLGSAEATRKLIKIYGRDLYKQYQLARGDNQALASFYKERLDAIHTKKQEPIFSLLEKAAELGDGKSSYLLACLYFIGKDNDYNLKITRNIEKALEYFKQSIQQGHAKAAIDLAALYIGEENEMDASKFYDESYVEGILIDLHQAKIALEQGVEYGKDADNNKGMCALYLARLHHEEAITVNNIKENRDKILYFYGEAVRLENSEAIAELGALYLAGDKKLQLSPDIQKSDEIFAKQQSYSFSFNVIKIAGIATGSSQILISKYLFWLIKNIEDDPRELKTLAYCLKQGRAMFYSGKNSLLLMKLNLSLAAECMAVLDLHKKTKKSEFSSDYILSEERNKFIQLPQYQQLIKDIYSHFELVCPFNFIPINNNQVTRTYIVEAVVDWNTPRIVRIVPMGNSDQNLASNRFGMFALEERGVSNAAEQSSSNEVFRPENNGI